MLECQIKSLRTFSWLLFVTSYSSEINIIFRQSNILIFNSRRNESNEILKYLMFSEPKISGSSPAERYKLLIKLLNLNNFVPLTSKQLSMKLLTNIAALGAF